MTGNDESDMFMKTYTIIAGVNGTGRRSLTGVLKTEKTDLGRIIDVDMLIAKKGSMIAGGKEAVRCTALLQRSNVLR